MCSIDNARARQRTTDDLSRSRISRRLVGRKWEASFSKASFSPRWRGFRTEVTGHACNAPPDQRTVHTGCANKHAPSRLDDERGKWERDRFELFLVFFFSSPSSSFFLILEYSDCIVDEVVLCEKFEKTTLTQRFVVKEYMKMSFLNYNLLRSFLFLRKENF